KYNGTSKKDYDLGLVGKGVVFDTGGINIKPSPGMHEMKGDMAGSAAVVGAMRSIALQKVKANVVGVIGLVENMPSDRALKPSDILVSKSGQTVEIGNTDAEGRLVLADCLTYIQEVCGVKKVIDIATLTGAAQMTFSYVYVPVMSNDDKFAKSIIDSGTKAGDKMWQLPLDEEYNKMLKSSVADMNNISSGKGGGTITAACFLQRFIKKGVTWAHVDMAGVDFEDNGKPTVPKGASGFGVKMFNQVVKDLK
ncbi:MAG: hypothetical protein LBL47_03150, partial [Lactobacillus sp.]|nr:hypothetical protein [Lactobacillus sp.]